MGMTWYPADWMTAKIIPTRLPLRVSQASYSLQGGTFSATLDMSDVSWQGIDRESMWDMVEPGTSSICGLREDLTRGSGGTQDKAMGEWWITGRRARYRSSVIELSGVCVPSYLKHLMFAQDWKFLAIDAVGRARVAVEAAFYSGQANSADGRGVVLTPGDYSSSLRMPVQWSAGSLTYWDAVEELSTAGFEWTIEPSLVTQDGVPYRMDRILRIQQPTLRYTRDDIVLRGMSEGREPGVILDYDYDETIPPNDLWLLGAGSGEKQITGRGELKRRTGLPRVSYGTTTRDILSKAEADRRALAMLRGMQKDDRVFEATADMELLPGGGPQIGHSHPWEIDPSNAVPHGESGRVRVVGWSWSQPAPGRRETVTLQLVRE